MNNIWHQHREKPEAAMTGVKTRRADEAIMVKLPSNLGVATATAF
jgi:hypothetical protein